MLNIIISIIHGVNQIYRLLWHTPLPLVTAIIMCLPIIKNSDHWSFLGNRRLYITILYTYIIFCVAVKPVRPLDDGQYRWGIWPARDIVSSLPPPPWSADHVLVHDVDITGHDRYNNISIHPGNRFTSPWPLSGHGAYKVRQSLCVKYAIKL